MAANINPEDVSPADVKKVLDFLNTVETPAEIAGGIEIPNERDVGLRVAERILQRRNELGGFTSLTQVAEVEYVGPERFSEIVIAVTGAGRQTGDSNLQEAAAVSGGEVGRPISQQDQHDTIALRTFMSFKAKVRAAGGIVSDELCDEFKLEITEALRLERVPRWDLDQDLAFRTWWNDILVYLRSEEDPDHQLEQFAAGFVRKLVVDSDLRERFAADPAQYLSRFGLMVPEGLTINVVENTRTTMNIVLPELMLEDEYNKKYEPMDLSDAELESFVGGEVTIAIFEDDFNTISLRDNRDHDVDVLPFQTNASGDKFKSKPRDTRNDFFG